MKFALDGRDFLSILRAMRRAASKDSIRTSLHAIDVTASVQYGTVA